MVEQPLTKTELDNLFTSNYAELESYVKKTIGTTRRKVDCFAVINECYLYLHSKLTSLYCKEDVMAYAKTWIRNSLSWNNSILLRQELPRGHHVEVIDHITQSNYDGAEYSKCDPFDIPKMFYTTLSSYDKRLFHIYFDLELQKGKQIAEYLDISISSAYLVIKECKAIEQRYVEFIIRQSILL